MDGNNWMNVCIRGVALKGPSGGYRIELGAKPPGLIACTATLHNNFYLQSRSLSISTKD